MTPLDSPPSSSGTRRSNSTATILTAAFIASGWLLLFAWNRFQLLETRPLDYLVLAALALTVSAFLARRPSFRAEQTARKRRPFDGTFVGAFSGLVLLVALAGGGVLLTVNALLDQGEATLYSALVVESRCGRDAHILARGPTLPTESKAVFVSLFLSCRATEVGDTVVLTVKPGFLRRPWIVSYASRPVNPLRIVCTRLTRAASQGDTSAIRGVLEEGVSIETFDSTPRWSSYGCADTPLLAAARHHRAATVTWLLAHGANPSHAVACGETPLMTAAAVRDAAIVGELLAHGADPTAVRRCTGYGQPVESAMSIALASSDTAVIRLIANAIPHRGSSLPQAH